jgi:hypothetical protein
MENNTFTSARKYFWYTNNYIRDTIYNNNIKDSEQNHPFIIKSRSGKLPTNLTTMCADLPLTYTRCKCGHFTETQVHALEYCTRNRRQIEQKYQSLTQTLAFTCRIKSEHASRLITKWKFDCMFRKTIAHSLLPTCFSRLLNTRIEKSKGRKNAINKLTTTIVERNKSIWEYRLSQVPHKIS